MPVIARLALCAHHSQQSLCRTAMSGFRWRVCPFSGFRRCYIAKWYSASQMMSKRKNPASDEEILGNGVPKKRLYCHRECFRVQGAARIGLIAFEAD
jgi:hypothetical protein